MGRSLPYFLFLAVVFVFAAHAATNINVHIVAHTHDDVGWLKTVDEYYYGANNSIQDARVQYILDNVVTSLQKNPSRKFIYVEIAYFWRWWGEQTDATKDTVRQLVKEGRFEFINGGWVMHDEGVVTSTDMIDQMTEGHDFLMREFGVRPTVGWHIDPFGHSASQPAIFARMGFDSFFFCRIDYQDYDKRAFERNLEFVWRGSKSLGKSADMFSSVCYDGIYVFPEGFWFEADDVPPIQSDPRLFNVNIQERANLFVNMMRNQHRWYATDDILVTYGMDFAYSNAEINFSNMDKLMKYINANQDEFKLNMFYSTPSIYTQALNKKNLTWTVKTDDFFPYSGKPVAYWTGYFTSRPAFKGYVRTRSNLLHAAQSVLAIAPTTWAENINYPVQMDRIWRLAEAMATAQHHDAVTGTEKEHVVKDYAMRLSIGSAETSLALNETILAMLYNGSQPVSLSTCEYLNVSICQPLVGPLGRGEPVAVIMINPLGWTKRDYVRLPVPIQDVRVFDNSGSEISSQILPNEDLVNLYTVVFPITVPPLGITTYFLQRGTSDMTHVSKSVEDNVIENQFYQVTFDQDTGLMSNVLNKATSKVSNLTSNLYWYKPSIGNEDSKQASGAYIYRPNITTPFPISQTARVKIFRGPFVSEFRQEFSSWARQTIRLYSGADRIETEAVIGPVDISDGFGKEVIRRYSTDLNTEKTWYTDANGLEMQQRVLNYRPTWDLKCTIPNSCDYYPITSSAFIKDNSRDVQLALANDRSVGCSSLGNGQLEIMLHRRLLKDDEQGVGEPLNETTVIKTTENLFLTSTSNSARNFRENSILLNSPPVMLFSSDLRSLGDWISSLNTVFRPLTADLPKNVKVETFKLKTEGEWLLRLAHVYAVGEDAVLSQPVTVELDTMFVNMKPVKVSEMTLTGNRPLSELNRLKWKTNVNDDLAEDQESSLDAFAVTLDAMEIRTFLVGYEIMSK
eukprot:TRINITY_DN2201_c3_g1_i1.p1 TRINITY_DN2201_c3_g1~~TRINITY_DN2201_c3_g1_i1.p1  ORF type:complete len:965 (+),score=294.76 TRINITY_DN2201_c3_g1_i1:158-3052(+)